MMKLRMMITTLVLLMTLAVSSCQTLPGNNQDIDSPNLLIELEETRCGAGERIAKRLSNETSGAFEYVRRYGGDWHIVSMPGNWERRDISNMISEIEQLDWIRSAKLN